MKVAVVAVVPVIFAVSVSVGVSVAVSWGEEIHPAERKMVQSTRRTGMMADRVIVSDYAGRVENLSGKFL